MSKAQLKATGAIGKTYFSAKSFYRVVFYDPIKHFSMKKSKNKVWPLGWYRLVMTLKIKWNLGDHIFSQIF